MTVIQWGVSKVSSHCFRAFAYIQDIMARRSDGLNWVAFFNKRTSNSAGIDGLLHQGANGVTGS